MANTADHNHLSVVRPIWVLVKDIWLLSLPLIRHTQRNPALTLGQPVPEGTLSTSASVPTCWYGWF
ncbi:hypothetical protein [Turicimonas muris]|uniref:hypothetical protein n=1 Tax=Turicimonas muris TaxID=1796652 RepID=UPI00262C3262|nr:hypothetical protein [Turicimonas muris]